VEKSEWIGEAKEVLIESFCEDKTDARTIEELRLKLFFVNADDSPGTKLIKTLLNAIYQYEYDIVRHIIEMKEEDDFSITKDKRLGPRRFYRKGTLFYPDMPTQANIAKLLGSINRNWVNNWYSKIQNGEIIDIREKTLLRIAHTTNKFFSGAAKEIANISIANFLNDLGKQRDFRVRLCLTFNKYTKKALGYDDLAELLGERYRSHLRDFKENNSKLFEKQDKFFRLLSNIYLLGETHLHLKDPDSSDDLKEDCFTLVYGTMQIRDIIRDNCRSEFEVAFYSYLAIKEKKGKEYTILDFSREVSETDYKSLFQDNLQRSENFRKKTIRTITDLIPRDSKYSKIAKKYAKNYFEYLISLSQSESERPIEWYEEETIKAHCTIMVVRDLGIDLATLKKMDPNTF
jgi:hypothetical protein